MSATRIGILLLSAISIGGCGLVVPDIQEFWGTPQDAGIKVNKIAGQIVCELRKAVQQVYIDEREHYVEIVPDPLHPPPKPQRLSTWFDSWGAQVTLTLNIVENTNLAPGVTFIQPLAAASTSRSLSLGATASSTATRTDKLNLFYTVQELKHGMPSTGLLCIPGPTNADLFVQSDLKLYDWLSAALVANATGIAHYNNGSSPKNGIEHEVKFDIVSDGSVNPTWTLVRFSGDTTGSLFAVGRDRSQDLDIAFGPIASSGGGGGGGGGGAASAQLAPAAENSHLATQIGLAVSQALKNTPLNVR
jgi:hypothetical protein